MIITWCDSGFAGFSCIQRFLAKEEAKLCLTFYTAMTGNTMFIDNRLYLGAVIHLRGVGAIGITSD